ncbi:CBS domain-containing protein [Methanospirillum sp.]|uniref:CBS domain-containing protein n=2 Tax=Methanospirillum sp. TaxID=45200 RepID=UPI002C11EAFB|nr:CBS domain-containing protein [Methanospirillum sp.]HOL40392.1 CBS domain-containing protein [Methanospirillum sp.]HPP77192.1 CBS domain-containing protein [Methanospirillum sp.]
MDGAFKLGRLFGIPVLIHFTFLLIIPLFAWVIGSDIQFTVEMVRVTFHVQIDDQYIISGYIPYLLGGVIAIGLFIGVFIHELAHSLIALRSGIRIDSITLLFFGGVAAIEEQEPEPRTELIMALAGPLTSLAIGLISAVLVYVIPLLVHSSAPAGFLMYIFGYLAILNILLFAFNLLPAFPMDGGRVLRAYLATRMPLHKATAIASSIGKGFAIIFGLVGLILFSPILILVAFFIYIGAGQESTVSRYNFLLRDVTVGQIMSRPVIEVSPRMPLTDVLSLMYQTKHLGFPVTDRGSLMGIITLTDLARTPVLDRDAMQVRDVMTKDVIVLPPHAPVMEALRIMTRSDIGRIPVMDGDKIVGIITKSDIFTVIELREV